MMFHTLPIYIFILICVVSVGGCAHNAPVNPSGLKPVSVWTLRQHAKVKDLEIGDNVADKFDQCRATANTVIDKHAIASRWIKTVTRKKQAQS